MRVEDQLVDRVRALRCRRRRARRRPPPCAALRAPRAPACAPDCRPADISSRETIFARRSKAPNTSLTNRPSMRLVNPGTEFCSRIAVGRRSSPPPTPSAPRHNHRRRRPASGLLALQDRERLHSSRAARANSPLSMPRNPAALETAISRSDRARYPSSGTARASMPARCRRSAPRGRAPPAPRRRRSRETDVRPCRRRR